MINTNYELKKAFFHNDIIEFDMAFQNVADIFLVGFEPVGDFCFDCIGFIIAFFYL
jgi:hypothetical protein